MNAKTRADSNGSFSLAFTLDEPLQERGRAGIATLKVERHGHITRKITILSMDYFDQEPPTRIKLKPQPVDSSLIGFSVQMDPGNSIIGRKTGTDAHFYIYIPESVKQVKAAFYISMHGIGNIKTPLLQRFAEEEQVALVGMNGDPVKRGITSVTLLEEYIKKLAEQSGHPELTTVPIMTFGHSNGTGFSASFPRDWPERTIAWVAFHPGFSSYLQFPNTDKVPALVMCGTADKYFLKARQDEVVASMRIRLNEDGSLKPVDIENGWLGAVYNVEEGGRQRLDVALYSQFKGDKSTANWLPDGEFAKAWKLYGQ